VGVDGAELVLHEVDRLSPPNHPLLFRIIGVQDQRDCDGKRPPFDELACLTNPFQW